MNRKQIIPALTTLSVGIVIGMVLTATDADGASTPGVPAGRPLIIGTTPSPTVSDPGGRPVPDWPGRPKPTVSDPGGRPVPDWPGRPKPTKTATPAHAPVTGCK